MTTQVKPLVGGVFVTINLTVDKVVRKNSPLVNALPAALVANALRGLNEWVNCGGTGTASVRAQEIAKALGFQIQEI